MNSKISESIRQTVIRLWLEGKSRKDIALICGVSEGTVSNIVSDWGQKLGAIDAEALRELGINLKRTGIDAAQCAQGFRITMIMRKMGVNEEDFESFVREVYEYCQRLGVTPENIASNVQELVKLSKDIPFAKIPEYIEKKKNEITKLEKDAKNAKSKKEISEIEAAVAKDLRDAALEDEKTTVAELREYSNLKAELKKYGLSIEEDIPKFTQVIHGIKQRGYDVDKVLSEYSDQEIKQIKRDLLIGQVKGLEDTRMRLLSECYFLKSKVNLHSQRLYVYDELKSMKFGLRELKILRNTIKEIAAENNIIDYRTAVDKLFEFLEQRYDIKLRQKVLDEGQQRLQKYNNTTKPDSPNQTFPYYQNDAPSTVLPKPSALVDRQQQRQPPPQRQTPSSSSFTSYTYKKITTTNTKTTKEQNNQLNNNNNNESYGSDDDYLL